MLKEASIPAPPRTPRNTFGTQSRGGKARPVTVDVTELEPFTVFQDVQDADPERTFFDRLVDDDVLRAIDRLPEDFRDVLVLSDIEGLTYAEIADVVGTPVGTVKSRLFRARQILQRALYDYAVEAGYITRRGAP